MEQSCETGQPLSRVQAGSIVRHSDGTAARIGFRKEDDSGWWLDDHGGLSDKALTSGDWYFVAESLNDLVTRFDRAVLSDIEARNPGIDTDEVQAHRASVAVIRSDFGRSVPPEQGSISKS